MSSLGVPLALVEFAILFGFTAWLVHFYATKGTHPAALVTVFISWYLGFFGTLFMPIDVAEAYYSFYYTQLNVTTVCYELNDLAIIRHHSS